MSEIFLKEASSPFSFSFQFGRQLRVNNIYLELWFHDVPNKNQEIATFMAFILRPITGMQIPSR